MYNDNVFVVLPRDGCKSILRCPYLPGAVLHRRAVPAPAPVDIPFRLPSLPCRACLRVQAPPSFVPLPSLGASFSGAIADLISSTTISPPLSAPLSWPRLASLRSRRKATKASGRASQRCPTDSRARPETGFEQFHARRAIAGE